MINEFIGIREGVTKKRRCSFEFCQNYPPPSPQYGQLVQLFLDAKNVDSSDIQNDSLSKILLSKARILALLVMYTT